MISLEERLIEIYVTELNRAFENVIHFYPKSYEAFEANIANRMHYEHPVMSALWLRDLVINGFVIKEVKSNSFEDLISHGTSGILVPSVVRVFREYYKEVAKHHIVKREKTSRILKRKKSTVIRKFETPEEFADLYRYVSGLEIRADSVSEKRKRIKRCKELLSKLDTDRVVAHIKIYYAHKLTELVKQKYKNRVPIKKYSKMDKTRRV